MRISDWSSDVCSSDLLGRGSYGVAAAALNYFNKPLVDLTIAEAAYLAGLPKAPNNYHPVRRHEAAVARRNYVITRMLEDGANTEAADRKSVVWGKGETGRENLGGCRQSKHNTK